MTISQNSSIKTITADEIQDWLAEQIADQLGIEADEIDIKAPFDSYGLESVQVMNIANLGKQRFGLHISPLLMWNYPNIDSLSQYIANELESAEVETFEI